MSNRQKLLLSGFVVGLIVFTFHLFNCDRQTTIARLNLPAQRAIIISGDYCWEVSRFLSYEVKQQGQIVTSKTSLGMDNGSPFQYEVIDAEGGALVGVLQIDRQGITPTELVIMQDFRSGESWPHQEQQVVGTSKQASVEQKWRGIFERLRRENQQIRLPWSFTQ